MEADDEDATEDEKPTVNEDEDDSATEDEEEEKKIADPIGDYKRTLAHAGGDDSVLGESDARQLRHLLPPCFP